MADFTWTAPDDMQALTATSLDVTNAADLTAVAQVSAGATGAKTATSSIDAALGNLAVSLVLRPRTGLPPGPDPSPEPDPGGDETIKYAQIDDSPQFAVAGVNPTSTDYPGGRGPNELVLYTDPEVTTTVTNQWGCEVQVGSDDIIDAVNDRQPSGDTGGTSVPSGGYVLSGHGTARTWLNTWASVDGVVTLTAEADPNPTPGGGGGTTPVPPTGSSAYPVKAVSVYKMMWDVNYPDISSISSNFNVIRLAFAQGDPPALVGWGEEGQSSALSALVAKRAAGVKVIISIGGSGGYVNLSNRTNFMSGIASIKASLVAGGADLDGLDWDVEASSLNQSDVVWISTQLKSVYGSDFAITFVPNGGNVSQYLPTAVACYRAGACDEYGQQFYDAPVSLSAAKGRISEALGAGLPQQVISVGMMIDSDANHWTNAQCASYYTDIRSTWPGITKAYLWEAYRSGTSQWASDMVRING